MWKNSICGILLDVKKCDMYREKDNKIHIVEHDQSGFGF